MTELEFRNVIDEMLEQKLLDPTRLDDTNYVLAQTALYLDVLEHLDELVEQNKPIKNK